MSTFAPASEETTRHRSMSVLSTGSKKSRRSNNTPKMDLTETHAEKKKLHTKADPLQALNEAQPVSVALEKSILQDLRIEQHKDYQGNVIMDPDRSNPTRPRFERPLDTIRSFEMAAEASQAARRATFSGRPVSSVDVHTNGNANGYGYGSPNGNPGASRRSSYYGNNAPQYRQRPGPGPGGYHQSRGNGVRPDSFAEYPQGPNQQYGKRMPSAPVYQGGIGENNGLANGHKSSYEGVTSGSDQANNSTNPSSLNSSVDQLHQQRKPDDLSYDNNQNGPSNGYSPVSPTYSRDELSYGPAHNGNGGSPEGMRYSIGAYAPNGNGQNGNSSRTPMPPPKPNNPRVPIKLDGGSSAEEVFDSDAKKSAEKKSGWFKKRFSKA